MFIKVRNYLAPNFTAKDFRVQVESPLANYVYGCHMTLVTRGALGYVSHQKGIIQGHYIHRYASKRAPRPMLQERVLGFTFIICKHQTVFLYYMSVKYTLRGCFWCFWCPCYALLVMSSRWNQYNFSTLPRLYIWEHRWIIILLLIFADRNNHPNTNVAGSKYILNRFWYIIWRPKAIFDQNVPVT